MRFESFVLSPFLRTKVLFCVLSVYYNRFAFRIMDFLFFLLLSGMNLPALVSLEIENDVNFLPLDILNCITTIAIKSPIAFFLLSLSCPLIPLSPRCTFPYILSYTLVRHRFFFCHLSFLFAAYMNLHHFSYYLLLCFFGRPPASFP